MRKFVVIAFLVGSSFFVSGTASAYTQIAGGIGFYNSGSSEDFGGSSFEQDFSGLTLSSQLLLGVETLPGLTLGGGLLFDYAPSPSYSVNGEDVELGDLSISQFVVSLGGFGNFYVTENVYVQGFIGWGGLETSSDGNVGGSDPTGLALAGGVGYDFLVGDSWNVGVLGRLTYGAFSLNDVGFSTIEPSVMVSLTGL